MLRVTDRMFAGVVALMLLLTSGCAQHLCALQASHAVPLPVDAPRDVTTAQWMMLMLRGPSHTCTGEAIAPARGAPKGVRALAAPRHLLAVDAAGRGKHLVWLQTHAAGEAGEQMFGPVAVVVREGQGFAVDTMGTLQALAGETRLRMAPKPAREALWAVSKRCWFHPELLRHVCHEQLQVLPRRGHGFASTWAAPRIDLQRQEVWPLAGGWYRIKEQVVQCDVQDMALIVQETIAVKEVSAEAPKMSARHRRTSSKRRSVTYTHDGGWTQSEPPLWPQVTAR